MPAMSAGAGLPALLLTLLFLALLGPSTADPDTYIELVDHVSDEAAYTFTDDGDCDSAAKGIDGDPDDCLECSNDDKNNNDMYWAVNFKSPYVVSHVKWNADGKGERFESLEISVGDNTHPSNNPTCTTTPSNVADNAVITSTCSSLLTGQRVGIIFSPNRRRVLYEQSPVESPGANTTSMVHARRRLGEDKFRVCNVQVFSPACNPGREWTGSSCVACPKGQYCSPNTELVVATNCPGGRYRSSTGAQVLTDCLPCPVGHYCGVATVTPLECPAGRYRTLTGATLADCLACGTENAFSTAGSPSCTTVSSGYYSTPDTGDTTTRTGQTQCQKGNYCASGVKTACGAGTYGETKGLTSASCTGFCPAGYFCPAGSTSGTANPCGGADKYCPTGSGSALSVPSGEYSTPLTADADKREATAGCEAGYYCISGVRFTCADGYYADDPGRTVACDQECPAGYFCSPGSPTPAPCGAPTLYCPAKSVATVAVSEGHYTTGDSPTTRSAQEPCPAGYACTGGERNICGNAANYCPPLTGVAKIVGTGNFSTPEASDVQHRTGQTACPPGTFCSGGVKSSCTGAGFYCPGATDAAVLASPGHYTLPEDGDVNARTGEAECPVGSYCLGGVKQLCQAGSYGSSPGSQSPSCSGACPAGFFCPAGTVSRFDNPCGSVDVYCEPASSAPVPVPNGTYSAPLSALEHQRTSFLECEPGFWCSGGVRRPCAAGRYSANASRTVECVDVCPPGFYCPEGSSAPLECGSPATYCPGATATALVVDDGFFSVNGTATQRTGVSPCQPGFFCSFGEATPCPGGTFGNTKELTTSVCSGRCPAGYFCPEGSLEPYDHPCGGVDRYCPLGSDAPTLVSNGSYTTPATNTTVLVRTAGVECPVGSYCTGGLQFVCPVGRFGQQPGASSLESGCAKCTTGYFCPKDGSQERDREECGSPDVYCPVGSVAPLPVDAGYYSTPDGEEWEARRSSQQLCPLGSWCQGGSRNDCPPGSYGGALGSNSSSCSGPCDAGYYCEAGSTQARPKACLPGNYCPGDGRPIVPCPAGRYLDQERGEEESDCSPCPAGRFQPEEGAVNGTEACLRCAGEEASDPGAASCWPALLAITANDASIPAAGIRNSDFLEFVFSKATDTPTFTVDTIGDVLDFSTPLASVLIPSWVSPSRLRVGLSGVDNSASGVDIEASSIGTLRVGVKDGFIRDAAETSGFYRGEAQFVNGSWGVATMPQLVFMEAINTGGGEGLDDGDTLRLQFDQVVGDVVVNTTQALDALLAFPTPVYEEAHGELVVDLEAGFAYLDVVLDKVAADVDRAATWFGALSVTLRPEAGLRSLDGESPPANGTIGLGRGSWGDPPCRVQVRVHSNHSLFVDVTPAARFPDTANFVVEWSYTDTFADAVSTPSTVRSVVLDGIQSGVPVFVRAAVGNTDDVLGPFLRYAAQGTVVQPGFVEVSGDGGFSTVTDCLACTRCSCVAAPSDLRDAGWGSGHVACKSVVLSPPIIKSVSLNGDRLSTNGGQTITTTGWYFGVAGLTGDASYLRLTYTNGAYGFEATGCVVAADGLGEEAADDASIPEQTMTCTSSPGVGGDHALVVVVGGDASAASADTIGYEPPVISEFTSNGTVAATAGHEVVYVHGKQFGRIVDGAVDSVSYAPSGFSATFTYAAVDCELVADHTLIRCLTAPGAGSRQDWTVVVAGQPSTTPFTSYRPPVVTMLSPAVEDRDGAPIPLGDLADLDALATSGGQYVDVHGRDFGASLEVVFDMQYGNEDGFVIEVPNTACTMVEPHNLLRCATPEGVGTDFTWSITVLDQDSTSVAGLLSYAPPHISDVKPCAGAACTTGFLTSAGGTVQVEGTGFGPQETAAQVSAFIDGQRVTPVSVVTPHVALQIPVPYVPFANELSLRVVVAGQVDDTVLTIAAPVVEDAVPQLDAAVPDDLPGWVSAGGAVPFLLSVQGSSFGAELGNVTVAIVEDGTGDVFGCHNVGFFTDHTSLECWAGFRGSGFLTLSTRGQTSNAWRYVFADMVVPPSIVEAEVPSSGLPTTGGTIRLTGTNLYSASSAGGPPSIFVLLPNPTTRASDEPETLLAESLWSAPCTVLIDLAPSETELVCVVDPGAGSGLRFVIFTRGLVGQSEAGLFVEYAPPRVTGVVPSSGPTAGGTLITLLGVNFGPPFAAAEVRVGGEVCTGLVWNHTVASCYTPEGVSDEDGTVVGVSVNGTASTPTGLDRFVYDAPAIAADYSITAQSPTQGGGVMTVRGSNFGPPGSLSVFLDHDDDASGAVEPPYDVVCVVASNTHTEAVCTLSAGSGSNLVLVLDNGGRSAVFRGTTFTYLQPSVDAVFDVDGGSLLSYDAAAELRQAAGGFQVTVIGSSFSALPTVVVRGEIDGVRVESPCTVTSRDHQRVTCLAPQREALESSLIVIASDGRPSPEVPFPYDPPRTLSAFNENNDPIIHASRVTALQVTGVNFGHRLFGPDRSVLVNGAPCASFQFDSDDRAQCFTSNTMIVGPANVTVVLGGGEESNPVFVDAMCESGFYGLVGENCTACSPSAVCDGGFASPVAREGFFRVSRSLFLACSPPQACPAGSGNVLNADGSPSSDAEPSCAEGYDGDRCSLCKTGYFRLDVSCNKCPDAAWVYILIFFVVVTVLLGVAYWVNKKQINLAGVTIGVDFAQVVAMFAAFDFNWPIELRKTMDSVSAANFNLQLLAPECTATFSFQDKWAVIACVPLAAVFFVVVLAAALRGMRALLRWRQGRGRRRLQRSKSRLDTVANADISALIGAVFTMMYYMYLQLVRNTLQVFDCTSIVGDDGVETLVLDVEPAIECSAKDPVYVFLFPAAVASVAVYVIGIPTTFTWVLFRHREGIVADQTLRCDHNSGWDALSNPNLHIRRKYQKLYNDFRPGAFYWRLVLMSRKCSLAFVAIMFDRHPMFQASLSILIMFASYAIHVHFSPFRSSTDVPPEVKEALVEKKKVSKSDIRQRRKSVYAATTTFADRVKSNGITYVFNYNRMETVLLISSTLILVGGMVFAAGTTSDVDEPLIADKSWQYYTLTALLIMLLVCSLAGFVVIIGWELWRSLYFSRVFRMGQHHNKKLQAFEASNPLRGDHCPPTALQVTRKTRLGAGVTTAGRSTTAGGTGVVEMLSKSTPSSDTSREGRIARLSGRQLVPGGVEDPPQRDDRRESGGSSVNSEGEEGLQELAPHPPPFDPVRPVGRRLSVVKPLRALPLSAPAAAPRGKRPPPRPQAKSNVALPPPRLGKVSVPRAAPRPPHSSP